MDKMLWIWSAIIANAVWRDWEPKLEILSLVEWYAIEKYFPKSLADSDRFEWGITFNLNLLTLKNQLINNSLLQISPGTLEAFI